MQKSGSCLITLLIYCCTIWPAGSTQVELPASTGMSNSIAAPGQPLYYLMADTGSSVGPNDELKRTNRSLLKWWDDLFGQNNCCNNNYDNNQLYNNYLPAIGNNNNCNGLKLQSLDAIDPFKQMKLFTKLPDLWGNNCGKCGGQQPISNYAAPVNPGYGGDGYAPAPVAPVDYNQAPAAIPSGGGYDSSDGPGDGDAGYVAPVAPPPALDSYAAPPAPVDYEAPAPAPPSYETPPQPAPYEPVAPPASESYSKVDEYAKPESYSKADQYAKPGKSYDGGAQQQQPQIVYQPIIYLSASPAVKDDLQNNPKQPQQSYEKQPVAPPQQAYGPPQIELPTYAPALAPAPAPAPAPAVPCNAPACGGYLPLLGVPLYGYPAGLAPAPLPPALIYAPSPPPAPVYAAPPPVPAYTSPPAPPAPSYSSPTCGTPIRLSLVDQPYRVAPELFEEYHYRLALADQNRLW